MIYLNQSYKRMGNLNCFPCCTRRPSVSETAKQIAIEREAERMARFARLRHDEIVTQQRQDAEDRVLYI